MQSHLGIVECINKVLIIKYVSFRLKQQFKNAVFNRFQLSLVRVYLHYQLIPLFFQIRPFQAHHIAVQISNNTG